jgi:hypothetical protein
MITIFLYDDIFDPLIIRMHMDMLNWLETIKCAIFWFNSLPAIGAHERQVFDKLLWGLVTSTIFVLC